MAGKRIVIAEDCSGNCSWNCSGLGRAGEAGALPRQGDGTLGVLSRCVHLTMP